MKHWKKKHLRFSIKHTWNLFLSRTVVVHGIVVLDKLVLAFIFDTSDTLDDDNGEILLEFSLSTCQGWKKVQDFLSVLIHVFQLR